MREQRRSVGPGDLARFERSVFSQNGEDGLIEEIFRRIGPGGRVFVEFGVEDGAQNCTRRLAEEDGWSGFWFEMDEEWAAKAAALGERYGIRTMQRMLDADNIVDCFAEAQVPERPDLMVIDVDGNDLWLWRSVASAYRARVVVIEYNGVFPPGVSWVMPYDPAHRWDRTYRQGASLDALTELGAALGYRLVACDQNGVNAFFVDDDAVEAHFAHRPLADVYVSPKMSVPWFGHPKRPPPETFVPPLGLEDAGAVDLRIKRERSPHRMAAGQVDFLDVVVHNGGARELCSGRGHPVNISYHWLRTDGGVAEFDGLRSRLPVGVGAGEKRSTIAAVRAPASPGRYRLRISLVQESVQWFDAPPFHGFDDLDVEVTSNPPSG